MHTLTSLPGSGQKQVVVFDGFTFPVLPAVEYRLDGPDKAQPDRLFIRDEAGRFMFSFEQDFTIDAVSTSEREFEFLEILHRGRKLLLWYPRQECERCRRMGYFRLECSAQKNQRPCCGQLMIARPTNYLLGLRENPEVFDVLSSIRHCQP